MEFAATRITPDLVLVDHGFRGHAEVIGSYVLLGPEVALVEAGPASTLPRLMAALRDLGVAPERVTRVVLTHIHLDHAGAAGTLADALPNARFTVHPRGARHLIDPERLLASARRIYGEAMDRLWGEVRPVPAERVDTVEDGARIEAGGRTLVAIDTPGHASHHQAYHDAESGDVFTGDVAGIRFPGTRFVLPPTPPPDIDLPRWHGSLDRLAALSPGRLLLTHFGPVGDPKEHLERLRARLDAWAEWMGGRVAEGADRDALVRELTERQAVEIRAGGDPEATVARHELATPTEMNVDGLARALSDRR